LIALRGLDGLVVLDEIHRRPDLFPLLRAVPIGRFLDEIRRLK
jgi:hypothetical protein